MAKQYSIADIGKEFEGYGLRIREHPDFGGVGGHSPGSYHYSEQAIDLTDYRPDFAPEYKGGKPVSWQQRTKSIANRAKQSGLFTEALGPGDANHDTHVHLALKDTVQATPETLQWIATGRYSNPQGQISSELPLQQKDAPLTGSVLSNLDVQAKNRQKEQKNNTNQFLSSFIADNLMNRSTGSPFSQGSAQEQLRSAFQTPELMT
jgi:hypothetical protein